MRERGSKWTIGPLTLVYTKDKWLTLFAKSRTYTGPRTTNIIDELPPEDPDAILGDYDIA